MKEVFIEWLMTNHIFDMYMDNFNAWHEGSPTLEKFLEKESHYSYIAGAFGWGNDRDWSEDHFAWCSFVESYKRRLNVNTKTL